MFKYIKQFLHDTFPPSEQFDDIDESPGAEISRNEEENFTSDNIETLSTISDTLTITDGPRESSEINDLDHIDPDEPLIRVGTKKSWMKNSGNLPNPEEENKKIRDSRGNQDRELDDESLTDTNEEKEKNRRKDNSCECKNCSVILEICECGVCLEPLQPRGIRSCPLCANIVCALCAVRLSKCAFCRIALPMQRNLAVERLVGKLFLPCRNARNGCEKLLNADVRLKHESSCNYASIACPVLKSPCGWEGNRTEVLSHLKEFHDLKPLASNGIAVEVTNFRVKTTSKLGECTVYLTCHSQLFAVKITTYRKKLILELMQLGYVSPVSEEAASINYGVSLKVKSLDGQSIRGILPFGKLEREIREIEINSDKLFSKGSKSPSASDTVNMEIFIRDMDNV